MAFDPFDWRSMYGMYLPKEAEAPLGVNPDEWRKAQSHEKVANALMQQAVAPGTDYTPPSAGRFTPAKSALSPLASMAQMLTAADLGRQANENKEALRLGMTPGTFPAYDDQGYAMPRAPGVAQPDPLTSLSNWWGNFNPWS